ncbi:UNVERIFIED_CONTAM: hypothetical protein Slati_2666000 [Sesamum latifolium]|uniref:MULE transposase domain-containing protein n=1 Tax=Sesamum latifolium TaxID=2727402 RepID=A0AAW2VUU1_9LAMI
MVKTFATAKSHDKCFSHPRKYHGQQPLHGRVGARQTNEDEDDGVMSGYSSDDVPLHAISENEGDKDEDENENENENEDEDKDESEDPMKNYLCRHMRGLREKIREYTLNKIDGNHGDSYSRLPHYAEMVRRSKHGRLVKLQYNHDENNDDGGSVSSIPIVPSFKRIFVGLNALKKCFLQGWSPFLGFDGCHLKGPYGGVLFAAIDLDRNNGLFPLAFVVVEFECKDNWCSFFKL